MAQQIGQGNIFGRVGASFGKGLAEQLPQEIERGRLAQGLKDFERDYQDLTPIQQQARLFAIPGGTPQMYQSFTELAKQGNLANAYGRAAGQQPGAPPGTTPIPASPNFAPANQARLVEDAMNYKPQTREQRANGPRTPNVGANETPKQIQNKPPLAENALPRLPWTPQQYNAKVKEYIGQGFTPEKAEEKASSDEKRYLDEPKAYDEQLQAQKAKSAEAQGEFDRQLSAKLQKTQEGIFQDIPGEQLENMRRGLERDLVTNPEASFKDIANDWSNRALNYAKTKNLVAKEAKKTDIWSIFQGDKIYDKLKSYQGIFQDAGNSEEYYNILRENPEEGGFGLSEEGAATVAFPERKPVKNYVNNYHPVGDYGHVPRPDKIVSNIKKAAIDIGKLLTDDDSLFTIARSFAEKDPYFDKSIFFKQLNDDLPNLRLNDRQRREIAEGGGDIIPSWGDVKVLPWSRRRYK